MQCYPLTWPIGIGDRFRGIYNRLTKEVILYDQRREAVEETKIISVDVYNSYKWKGQVSDEIYNQVCEELDLVEGVLPPFDVGAFLAGKLSPVTFGSAKQNFGVDVFLNFFSEFAPGPQARMTKAGLPVDPCDENMTGFVFKIQANMDRRHRDRVAFIRLCSGKFERGMKIKHSRHDKEIRLAYSNQFVAADRETVDIAYAGDIVGVNDTGNFAIGDSVSTTTKLQFEDIPKFAPELFARMSVSDAMRRKKMQEALQHLSEEGAIQLFIDPIVGIQDAIIGVVGELQFEVLVRRMLDEYNLEVRLMRLPFSVARWPRSKDGKAVDILKGNFTIYRDMIEQPVILLNQEWDLNWAKKENPEIDFATSISRAR
jgi:peptide chain release factor 3